MCIIIFRLLINAVILLLNCLVLILYLYIHFLPLRHYFLYLNIVWSFIFGALDTALKVSQSFVSLLLHFMVLKTISPGFGVRASLMLFLCYNLTSAGLYLLLSLIVFCPQW